MIRLFWRSGIISEQELELFRPKRDDGRPIGEIADTATLYRRFQPSHFESNGDLRPQYFAFPKKKDNPKSGQSFLLKGLALAFHALHRDCNDSRPLPPGEWLVSELPVAGIPYVLEDPMKKRFYFRAIHAPYSTCKAHCELFCSDKPSGIEYVVPGEDVKLRLRIHLARQFKPAGARLIVKPPEPPSRAV